MKSILALDVSARCTGFCFGTPGTVPVSGIVRWGGDGVTEDEVFRKGLIWLTQHMSVMSPDIVAIEAPIKASGGGFTNSSSQAMLIGLQGVLRAVVKAKLPGAAHLVASSTVRKTFLGKGGHFDGDVKDLVQAEAVRRGFIEPGEIQPDRCDAIALWTHMAAQQLPELKFNSKARP